MTIMDEIVRERMTNDRIRGLSREEVIDEIHALEDQIEMHRPYLQHKHDCHSNYHDLDAPFEDAPLRQGCTCGLDELTE